MIDPRIAAAYLPSDRRRCLACGEALPELGAGVVLFADISGFTPLTVACVAALGPTRGAEVATRHLNAVYDGLVGEIHARGGSVVGFSGDGMLCWFPEDANCGSAGAARAALNAAAALHIAIAPFGRVPVAAGVVAEMGLKIAIAGGRVRRLVVGDPEIQLIDVLAGQPVDAVSEGERLAQSSESWVEAAVVAMLGAGACADDWQVTESGYRFARLEGPVGEDTRTGQVDDDGLTAEQARPWLLPALAARLEAGQTDYLAELRPASALFLRFAGLDFIQDEAVGAKLNVLVQWAQRIVAKMGGALLQLTTGDKGSYLYASFGAMQMHADDPARAAAAGLALLSYREIAPWLTDVRIGVAGGRTRVGPYGAVARCTFGAQGSAVNLAARLMMSAAPNTVVVDQSVADAVRHAFQVESLGRQSIKGATQPVALYRLIGRRDPVAEIDPESGRVRRIGRAQEWIALCGALDAAQAGQGRWVSLGGPAGAGKSRLAAELGQRASGQGMRVIMLRGESTLRDAPNVVIGNLVRNLLSLARTTPADVAVESVTAWFARHRPEWQSRMVLLRDVLELPLPQTPLTAGLDARQRQDALMSLVTDLAVDACRQQPTLLVVEDGQHVDEASWAALMMLARHAAGLPLLGVVCARSGDEPVRTELAAVESQRLELGPLDVHEIGELVEVRLGKPVDELIKQIVAHLTHGNPAFVLTLVEALLDAGYITEQTDRWMVAATYFQSLREARALTYGDGGWRLAPDKGAQAGLPGLPDSLYGTLLAKVDRLGDEAKLILKVASVVGRTFELAVVKAVNPTGLDGQRLIGQMTTWVEQGVLAAADEYGPERLIYQFRQSMLQEALYQSLLETQQRALHTAVGWALEGVAPSAVDRLARHFVAADLTQPSVRDAAVRYLGLAAAKSRRENANDTARHFLAQLITLAPLWTNYRELVEVLHLLGRRDEEAAALAEGRTLADVDPAFHALLSSRYWEAVARYDDAWAAAQSALSQATVAGEIAVIEVQMARIAGREGDYRREEQHYQQALAALAADPSPDMQARIEIYYGLGTIHKQQGNYGQALDELTVALDLAATHGPTAEQARVLMAMGVVSRMQRRFDQAHTYTEQALRLRREIGDRAGEGDSVFSLAQVVIHGVGDYAQGRALLTEALVIQQTLGNQWGQAIVLNELGVVHYLIGLYAEAERILASDYALCRTIGASAGLVYVQWNLGLTLREQGRASAARDHLAQALADADALDDPHVKAQLHGELGVTELALGEASAARDYAEAAVTGLEQLGLSVMTPADLATLAQAALNLGEPDEALRQARQAIAILDGCRGEGPDFPHREYRRCGDVLAACGESDEAAAARENARRLLEARAAAISDAELRAVFLEHSPGVVGSFTPSQRRV